MTAGLGGSSGVSFSYLLWELICEMARARSDRATARARAAGFRAGSREMEEMERASQHYKQVRRSQSTSQPRGGCGSCP